MRWRYLTTVLTAAFALSSAACDALKYETAEPTVRVGDGGELPAVVSLRSSAGTDDFFTPCAAAPVQMQLRFSHPMDRENVEQSIRIDEVTGDIDGTVLPLIEGAVLPQPDSFQWEDNDRQVNFIVPLLSGRQYLLYLPASVTNREGRGLDGLVGYDPDADGATDIVFGPNEFARADDDFWRRPIEFRSLPFFKCVGVSAPSVWYTPLDQSRPRVLEFRGLIPNSHVPPTFSIANGSYALGSTDGSQFVERPLPSDGILRLRIASPNTAPTRSFSQRRGPSSVLPSTVVSNMTLEDESFRTFGAAVYLDNRLQVRAPIQGVADSADNDTLYSGSSLNVPVNSLAGLRLVTRGRHDYLYEFGITGNSATAITIDTEYVLAYDVKATDFGSDWSLIFPSGTFRENEIAGLLLRKFLDENGTLKIHFDSDMIADGNTAKQVRKRSGQRQCVLQSGQCIYKVYADLDVMEVAGKDFEVVADYLYVAMSGSRLDGERYFLRLNSGSEPITDIYGRSFVDGKADGDDTSNGVVDDEWVGTFAVGDYDLLPIPPRLQLNDGRWYSPYPEGSKVGAELDLGNLGVYTYLGNGVMGRYRTECANGATRRLVDLGFVFATPDGSAQVIGDEDILQSNSVSETNVAAYRMNDLQPVSIPAIVGGLTVSVDFYKLNGDFLKRQQTTLVRLSPRPLETTVVVAGPDGKCATGDDHNDLAIRNWVAGDRILLSHRLDYPAGEDNTLDGNYDGLLTEDEFDDFVAEYTPNEAAKFRVLPVGERY